MIKTIYCQEDNNACEHITPVRTYITIGVYVKNGYFIKAKKVLQALAYKRAH
jgi:hypothetical protein